MLNTSPVAGCQVHCIIFLSFLAAYYIFYGCYVDAVYDLLLTMIEREQVVFSYYKIIKIINNNYKKQTCFLIYKTCNRCGSSSYIEIEIFIYPIKYLADVGWHGEHLLTC